MSKKRLNPGQLVVSLFGVRPLAAEIQVSPTTVLHWRDKGEVSADKQKAILELARKRRVPLTAEELIYGR